ncbi:caspase family protein [Calothrix sp. 336/3]|uniref:caspase family protein n=1 Tax=Calothrix sp. 336/3 TaxID=1337936 RepID=UPI0004E3D5D7|nr:caspase family protein [Calothrix sp. 336/3]AKG21827.1 peptidase C14 [Calothrix sp. 336/3]
MANNWAIAIGINQYQFFQGLGCAQADAEALKDFLVIEAGFLQQQCLLMTDTSAPLGDRSTYPTKENILLLIEDLAAACWQPGDRLWFLFSGYGVNYQGQDYLMPIEGKANAIAETGIEVRSLMQSLQVTSVEVILLLDINRVFASQGHTPVGQETIELAQELQIPTILSCQPEQYSHESAELGHGFFTSALLEALRSGNGNTLIDLERYLSIRTPELCQHYWRPTQNPVTIVPYRDTVSSHSHNKLDWISELSHDDIYAAALPSPNAQNHFPQKYSAWHQVAETRQPEITSIYTEDKPEEVIDKTSATNPVATSTPSSISRLQNRVSQIFDRASLWQPFIIWGASTTLALGLISVIYFRSNSPESKSQTSSQIANLNNQSRAQVAPPTPKTLSRDVREQMQPISPDVPTIDTKESPTITPKALASFDTPPPPPSSPESPIAPPPPTASPSPQVTVTTTSKPATAEQEQRNQSILKTAASMVNDNQASNVQEAIAIAKQIKPGEPLYQEAQGQILAWNQKILQIANNRAKQGKYSSAIAAAKLITSDNPTHSPAQTAIQKWRQQAKQHLSNKTVLEAANLLIEPGQASSYNRAIEVAKKVPQDEPGFPAAQKSINQWSEKILDIAKKRASKGEYKTAINTAKLVPEGTTSHKKAQQAMEKWQKKTRN